MRVGCINKEIYDFLSEKLSKEFEVVNSSAHCDILIKGSLNEEEIYPRLKALIVPFTGINGVDLKACHKNNIRIFNTHAHSLFVAEKAVSLTLTLLGNAINYHNNLVDGNWSKRTNQGSVPWTSLQNKNVGIYGFGHIGKDIYRLLKGFIVRYYVLNRNKKYEEDVNIVSSIEELVRKSDVIIIAAPLNDSTSDTFCESILSNMKDKYLINVGRGKIINELALFNALKHKTLLGFASDVWYNYPTDEAKTLPSSYPINEFRNVVLSPHTGGLTDKSRQIVYLDIIDTINNIKQGNYEKEVNFK